MMASMILSLFVVAVPIGVQANHPEQDSGSQNAWEYVTKNADGISGGSQPLWLTEKRPDDFDMDPNLETETLRFSSFQYGSAASRFVTVVLVEDDTNADLYVDSNRDRKLSADERVHQTDDKWMLELDAEFAQSDADEPLLTSRLVRFERSRFGESIRVSTVGFLSGSMEWPSATDDNANRTLSVRVADADVNGRFGDADDLIWVDSNSDGTFDPFLEKMTLKKGLKLDGHRFQFATDEMGSQIEMNLVEGTGRIEFLLDVPADIVSSQMTLVSRDGTTVPLAFQEYAETAETSVPVGQYRISTLAISLLDPISYQQWNYTFSALRRGEDAVWYPVTKGGTTEISPVETLDFAIQIHEGQEPFREGSNLFVSPRLTTESGLYINNCWQGEVNQRWLDDGRGATIRLSGPSLTTPTIKCSGFR